MFISELRIRNYRGLRDNILPLGEVNILTGENNAGKTSIIDALRTCLSENLLHGKRVFNNYDYHLASENASPATAPPIEITLTVRERKKDEWSKITADTFGEVLHEDASGLRNIILQVTSQFDENSQDYRTDYRFLRANRNAISLTDKSQSLMKLQRQFRPFHIPSHRDIGTELKPGNEMWDDFGIGLKWNEEDARELEVQLAELNNRYIMADDKVKFYLDRLNELHKLMPTSPENSFRVEGFATRVFDIHSKLQMFMAASTGAQIPIVNHGIGVQNIVLLKMYGTYMQLVLNRGLGVNINPLLLLEEPEAHLHASAASAFGNAVLNFPGQRIIATHSAPFQSKFNLANIFTVKKHGSETLVNKIDEAELVRGLNKTEEGKLWWQLNDNVFSLTPFLLQSRLWLLLEGVTDATILAHSARTMGIDLADDGISSIRTSEFNAGFLIRLANQLGIEWFLLADGDTQGNANVKKATELLDGRKPENHILQHKFKGIELLLCMEGLGHIYEESISPQNRQLITLDRSAGQAYYEQVLSHQIKDYKTYKSLDASLAIREGGPTAIPPTLKKVIEKVSTLAEGAA